MILTLKCDHASLLMSESLDRPLRWYERAALKGHLWVCSVCPELHRRLMMIGKASRSRYQRAVESQSVPDAKLSDDAKERIKQLVNQTE